MKKWICIFLWVYSWNVSGQPGYDPNGVAITFSEYFALTHVTLFTGKEKLTDATLIIRDGRIEQAGNQVNIPASCQVYDCGGICVYPSFIDIFSTYGLPAIPNPQSSNNQLNSSRRGPYCTNEAIRPETRAAQVFQPDENNSAFWASLGFGVFHSIVKDGIARGSGCLSYGGTFYAQKALKAPDVSRNFSFERGSSSQDYPRSLMGVIALLRQTFYDAKWYSQSSREFQDLGLEAWNKQLQLPVFFESGSIWNHFRIKQLSNEFGFQPIIMGTGEEYQRLDAIKSMNVKWVIPIKLPTPKEIPDSHALRYLNYKNLIHWNNASYNLSLMQKEKIPFCITPGKGHGFWANAEKVIKSGLSTHEFLISLTTRPAEWLGLTGKIGCLLPGADANFFMSTDTLFGEGFSIISHYIRGKSIPIEHSQSPNFQTGVFQAGSMVLKLYHKNDSQIFILDGGNWKNIQVVKSDFQYLFTYKNQGYILKKNEREKHYFLGVEGKEISWPLRWIRPLTEGEKSVSQKKSLPQYISLRYPLHELGDSIPFEQKKATPFIIRGAMVWTGIPDKGPQKMDVAIAGKTILAIGPALPNSAFWPEIDGNGKHVTPGIIDEHSHIAIHGNVNEGTQSVTSEVRIGDVLNPEDVNIYRQLAGGVTSSHLLHGSANCIGGQTQLIKLRWGAQAETMKVTTWPGFIKFALGENVKQSNWGDQAHVRFPQSRMGVEQTMFDAFWRAKQYQSLHKSGLSHRKDLELDALVEILEGKRHITCHSYVQSEINMLMHVADSMGFKVNTFTHILEGYKVADKMKKHGAAGSTFADWWAYKYEVMEAIPYNAFLMDQAGIVTGINSDDAEMARRLNQEAAKSLKYGQMTPSRAMAMISHNPALMLKINTFTGTLEPGKDADLVLWNADPLSIYARPLMTWVDGIRLYDELEMQQRLQRAELVRNEIWKSMQKSIEQGEIPEKPVHEQETLYHCGHE